MMRILFLAETKTSLTLTLVSGLLALPSASTSGVPPPTEIKLTTGDAGAEDRFGDEPIGNPVLEIEGLVTEGTPDGGRAQALILAGDVRRERQ